MRIEATAGGGMVTVVVNGHKQLLSIKIDPEVVSKDDVEMLQDLIVAAVNDAHRKVDEALASQMQGMMGGLKHSRAVLMARTDPLAELVTALQRLPGIGARSAQRLAYHLLKTPREEIDALCAAMLSVKERVTYCSICSNITDVDPCRYCTAPRSRRRIICVVEQPENVAAIEKTRGFHGRYHVLMGTIAPLQGIGPDDLKIKGLLARVGRRRRRGSDPRDQSQRSKAKRPRCIWRGCSSRSACASRASRWACPSAAISTTRTSSRCPRRWKAGGRCPECHLPFKVPGSPFCSTFKVHRSRTPNREQNGEPRTSTSKPRPKCLGVRMTDQLLETWHINNRVNLMLIDHITEPGLRSTLSTRGGRDVARQFAHMHNVRVGWLDVCAKDLHQNLQMFGKDAEPSKAELKNALTASAEAIAKLLQRGAEAGGKIKGFKRGVVPMLGYFIAHEGHHRGSILLTLKQTGHKVSTEVQYGIWEWTKI